MMSCVTGGSVGSCSTIVAGVRHVAHAGMPTPGDERPDMAARGGARARQRAGLTAALTHHSVLGSTCAAVIVDSSRHDGARGCREGVAAARDYRRCRRLGPAIPSDVRASAAPATLAQAAP